ncbi:MAG: MopE-related protein [Myxococcota bacterium]
MRARWAAVAVVGWSLACGSFSTPPAELHGVQGGTCATLEGTVSGHGEQVVLTVDGAEVSGVVAPADGSRASWSIPVSPGSHVVSHRDTSVEHTVVVPGPSARVDWAGFGREVREGQILDPIHLELVSPCGTDGFTAHVSVDGARVLNGATATDLVFDVGRPSQGTHQIEVVVLYEKLEVGRQTLGFEIGPPCTEKACRDRDGDGHDGVEAGGDDCDDDDPRVHPGAKGFPDPDGDGAIAVRQLDFDCDGVVDTSDAPFDCDETNPRIPRPEEPEPTGVDEDCDGLVDEGTRAYDDDGDGVSEDQGDCRDDDARVAPGKPERADCKDNDCNGAIDDGVTLPQEDDRYEPNDTRPWALHGAQKKSGFFGGYTTTSEPVTVVLRDARDVEVFTLFAHDGPLDLFHVTVRVDSIGDGLAYEARVTGPNRSSARFTPVRGVASASGGLEPQQLVTTGKGLRSDTGEYTITIQASGDIRPWCPLELTISSG